MPQQCGSSQNLKGARKAGDVIPGGWQVSPEQAGGDGSGHGHVRGLGSTIEGGVSFTQLSPLLPEFP